MKRSITVSMASRSARVRADLLAMLLDVVLLTTAIATTLLLRYDGSVPRPAWSNFLHFLPVAAVVVLASNTVNGLYAQIWQHASIVEARRLLRASALSVLVLLAVIVSGARMVPLSVLLSSVLLYTAFAGASRYQSRLFAFHRWARPAPAAVRVLVVGAGEAGAMLVREMRNERGVLVPVGFLDDNPRKWNHRLLGLPVSGPIGELVTVARQLRADQVLLAIPTAQGELVRQVMDLAESAELPVRMIPSLGERSNGQLGLADVREIRVDDLLGRPQISTDLAAVRRIIAGKRVLVTGAGGSIGSEIARQVAGFGPAQLLLLDHDETHLHDVCATIGSPVVQVLADIRQRGILNQLFARYSPQVVFHAAAHKHVPLLEEHPCEAVRTNVCGTDSLVAASLAVGVDHFVFISTDKAVQPSSVMGATKRIGEHLVLNAPMGHSVFSAVRFGNVLGSRGSVMPTFLRQIAEGGPITVTDARMTRFFMTIPEAVQLVLQASAFAEGGEVFMLNMGEPVNIRSLAERLIRLQGRRVGTDVEIRVTGVRPGEKLTEELHTPDEELVPTAHPSIVKILPERVPNRMLSKAVESLNLLSEQGRDDATRSLLFDIAEGRTGSHRAGLLTLTHRRRATDRGEPVHAPGDLAMTGRRTSDLLAQAGNGAGENIYEKEA